MDDYSITPHKVYGVFAVTFMDGDGKKERNFSNQSGHAHKNIKLLF